MARVTLVTVAYSRLNVTLLCFAAELTYDTPTLLILGVAIVDPLTMYELVAGFIEMNGPAPKQ
jgi:hypothetical protein